MAEPISQRAAILVQFMKGEIDARSAVAQLKRLPRGGAEHAHWPEGTFPQGHVETKWAELKAAWLADEQGPAA